MKELTIEQKARRYDKALERAKGAHNGAKSDKENGVTDKITEYTIQLTETIFPELKESEDERIRKWCISHFKECINVIKDNDEYKEYLSNKVIAWLEKIGKNTTNKGESNLLTHERAMEISPFMRSGFENEDKVEPKFKVGDVMRTLQEASDGIKDGLPVVVSIDDECYRCNNEIIPIADQENYEYPPKNRKQSIDWLEKQGNLMKALQTSNARIGELIEENYYLKKQLEKQGEHKHTDKVESKFHEGEWITNGDYTWKIVEVKPLDYILQSQDGNIVDDTISHVEEQFHSFTIEDARDGDVIYSRHNTESFEWIGIYKSLDKENKRVFFYGFWHDMAKTFSVCGNEAYVLYDDFSPATKEQRDLLFQKMKEAGYVWDSERKELKKVEQKPTTMSLDEAIEHCKEKSCGNNACALEHKQLERWLTELKELKERSLAWSGEDSEHLDSIIESYKDLMADYKASHDVDYIPYDSNTVVRTVTDDVNFLESLKDRVQPQNTWKPSDEQMEQLKKYCPDNRPLTSLYKQLKKLKG